MGLVAVYEGELRYCLSPSLVQAALKTKVARLTDDSTGLFGALEKTTLGEVGDAKEETPKPFPTVSRAAGRDGVGDGRGVGEEVQRGAFLSLLISCDEGTDDPLQKRGIKRL